MLSFRSRVPRKTKLFRHARSALDQAAEFQKEFFPKEKFEIGPFQVAGLTSPSHIVNGDFYNYFSVGRRGKLGVAIGDITGHGVEADIYFTLMQHLFREKSEIAAGPSETMHLVEYALSRIIQKSVSELQKRMLVPATWIEVNVSEASATIIRAGHTLPLLVDPEGNSAVIYSKGGMLLNTGLYPDMYVEDIASSHTLPLDETTLALPPGWTLINYTDGLSEMLGSHGQPLGDLAIRETIKSFVVAKDGFYTSSEICHALMDLAFRHRGSARQHDDCTVVAIRHLS